MSEQPTRQGDLGMHPEAETSAAAPGANALPPGAWLSAARQAQALTVEQVASQLNLAPRQILALEADDYAALPGMVIVRGFLRSYAKLLRIDPVPLLAVLSEQPQLGSAVPIRHALSASFSESRLPSLTGPGERSRTLPIVAGLAVLVVAAAASYALGWWPEALTRKVSQFKLGAAAYDPAQPFAASALSAPAALAAPAAPAVEPAVLISSQALAERQPASGALASPALQMATPATPAATSDLPAPALTPSPVPAAPVPVSSGATGVVNPLVLNIQADSWIEIKRADNTPVVARILKAGSVETFDVSEPVTLTVGNIAGVAASLRGAPLELASNANGNVARLRLK